MRIASKDAEARAAIHDFLRFQIEDHETGDADGDRGRTDSEELT